MGRGEYTINNLYQPGYSSYKPGEIESPNYLGKKNLSSAGSLGVATNPTIANQIGELSKLLNAGTIPVEIGTLDLKTFDSIPKEHWNEMRRKADLNDAKLTLHSPLVDTSGFGERGWDATQQKIAEMQLIQIMDKAAMLTSKKNPVAVPVTIHPSNYAGSTYIYRENPETKKREKFAEQLIAIDKRTGQLLPISRQTTYHLGGELGKVQSAEKMLEAANEDQWEKEIEKVLYEKETAGKIIDRVFPAIKPIYEGIVTNQLDPSHIKPEEAALFNKLEIAQVHLQDARRSLDSAFEKAYLYGDEKDKQKLVQISQKFKEELGLLDEKEFKKLSKEEQQKAILRQTDLQNQATLIHKTAESLKKFNPQLLQRVEDFAIEKTSETLKNVALDAYKKSTVSKIVTPQISVENLYQGMGFSQPEDVAKIVERTRNEFQLALMQEGVSSTEAKKQAEQIIGATFDVGHLNLSRKKGFNEEELKKEAEYMGKYVNKVHLTDNFGNEDTHLPIGMGNVPVELLLDALGDAGKKAVKINEIGGYTANFGKVAYGETLAAFGSPVYTSGEGPYWSQTTGFQQSYSGGFGSTLPQVNYETFGAGFSSLPQELGGSRGGSTGGRMGGGE